MISMVSIIYNTELEFERYMRVKIPANNDSGLLSWLETNKDKFPILTKIACSILYILVSGAETKRVISVASNTTTKKMYIHFAKQFECFINYQKQSPLH